MNIWDPSIVDKLIGAVGAILDVPSVDKSIGVPGAILDAQNVGKLQKRAGKFYWWCIMVIYEVCIHVYSTHHISSKYPNKSEILRI